MITSNIISLTVYYETPEGKLDEVKNNFENLTKNNSLFVKNL